MEERDGRAMDWPYSKMDALEELHTTNKLMGSRDGDANSVTLIYAKHACKMSFLLRIEHCAMVRNKVFSRKWKNTSYKISIIKLMKRLLSS